MLVSGIVHNPAIFPAGAPARSGSVTHLNAARERSDYAAAPARTRAFRMSDDYVSEVRRRFRDFASRAVGAARTASAASGSRTHADEAEAHANSAPVISDRAGEAPETRDERDETIATLEQALEAERARSTQLEGEVKALEFKLDVLEKSYGKQLADARASSDSAREELSEIKARLRETTLELREVAAVRDRLRDMLAFDGRRIPPELRERQPGDDDTIARLMSPVGIVRDAGAEPGRPARDEPGAEPEPKELLSPELVFDRTEERDDDGR